MRKRFLKTITSLFLVALAVSSCSSNDDNKGTVVDPPKKDFTLVGKLTEEKVLKAGSEYELVGGFEVEDGGKLIIEEGVTIKATRSIDGAPDYILVKQGGKIIAQGTKEKPIVMTSTRELPGSWGGLHICGKAPINLVGGVGKSEIGNATFGGDDPTDNSGVLKYVRLEYTGFAFSSTKESNGFTFYGVGDGTTLEYLQSYKGADDGFEWFGGTVSAKYLVSTSSEDDSFDWTDGWVGKGQFWVAYQDQSAPDSKGTALGDCLIEADNREDNFTNIPVSHPVLANLTLVGNKDSNKQLRGVRLRAGTEVELYNTIIVGKEKSVTVATDDTVNSFIDNNSFAKYIYSSKGFFNETDIELDLNADETNVIATDIELTNGYLGVIAGGKDLSQDAFFVVTNYLGAVIPNADWTAGWTR